MATLSKAEKEYILKELNSSPKGIELKCDAYQIRLKLERFKMKLVIGIYINNQLKGSWFTEPEAHPETKYLPIRKRAYYSPQKKGKIIKLYGKRQALKEFPNLNKVHEQVFPYFNTGRAALTHLLKVSESVELVGGVPSEQVA